MRKALKTIFNRPSKSEVIAFINAAEEGNNRAINKFLDAYPGFANVETAKGETLHRSALEAAIYKGHVNTVQLLINRGVNIHRKSHGTTPLMWAADQGEKEILELLLDQGAKIDVTSLRGGTALTMAAMMGHKDVALVLIARGANVHIKDDNGWTPLINAAFKGGKEIVKALLEKKVDVNHADKQGRTALPHAVMNGDLELTALLLENGAGINIADKKGATPLMEAADRGNLPILKLLLDKGADADMVDNEGRTARMIAEKCRRPEAVEFMDSWVEDQLLKRDLADFSPALKQNIQAPEPIRLRIKP